MRAPGTAAAALVLALVPAAAGAQWRAELAAGMGASRLATGSGALALPALARGAWRLELLQESGYDAFAPGVAGAEARTALRLGWARDARWGVALEAGATGAWTSARALRFGEGAVNAADSATSALPGRAVPVWRESGAALGPTGGLLAWRRVRGIVLTAGARTTGAGGRAEAVEVTRVRLVDSVLTVQRFDSVSGAQRTDTIGSTQVQRAYTATEVRDVLLRQTDVSVGASGARGPLAFALAAGTRWTTDGDGAWGRAAATLALRDGVALSLVAARRAGDVLRGLPARRELQLGVVLRPRRAAALPVAVPAGAATGARTFAARRSGDGTVTLTVDAPGARSVEVMGDFSAWRPLPMERQGGAWRLTTQVPPGVHRLNVRVDGGEWGPPPGTTAADDGFGGQVGVVVIE